MQADPTGDVCIYFPVENLIQYVTRHNPRNNTRSSEVLLSVVLLRVYERIAPNNEYLIGFPVVDKHIAKYQKHFFSDTDLAHFIDKDRKEATHVDMAIATLRNGEVINADFYQLKRFGEMQPYKNDDDLIALFKKLENNPKTGVTLLIHVKHARLTVSKAYKWLKGKDFPYDNVVLFSAEPNAQRLVVKLIYLYPQRAIGTFGINLTPGVRPYGRVADLLSALSIFSRVATHRAYDRLMYFVVNRVCSRGGFYNRETGTATIN